jgi:exodeoxyribonuclease V gamma subunit
MLPMRSIPFKVVCMVGLDNDAFPRNIRPLSFDLIARHPQPGDRSRRKDDKYLFLEAILSARQKLYISYVGQSIQDNTPIPPCVLVSELMDALDEGFGGFSEKISDHLLTRHRLQAFSPDYFREASRLFSYSRENFSAHTFKRAVVPVFLDGPLPEPDAARKTLSPQTLCTFMNHPTKFWFQQRLNMSYEQNLPIVEDRENFKLDSLQKYLIGQDLVDARLAGENLKDLLLIQRSQGRLPHGRVGQACFSELSLEADGFVKRIEPHIKGLQKQAMAVDLEIDGFILSGQVADICKTGLVHMRYGRIRARDLLTTWIQHLIACAAGLTLDPVRTLLLGRDSGWEIGFVENSREILAFLLTLYWCGLSEPVHFFPESSMEYAKQRLVLGKSWRVALDSAQKKWLGSDFRWAESADPYYSRCFDRIDPLDEMFQKTAEDVFKPLFGHALQIML